MADPAGQSRVGGGHPRSIERYQFDALGSADFDVVGGFLVGRLRPVGEQVTSRQESCSWIREG